MANPPAYCELPPRVPEPTTGVEQSADKWQMWHRAWTKGSAECSTHVVSDAGAELEILVETIAWHPNPAIPIYAVAHSFGDIHIVDYKRHRCVRSLGWTEMAENPFSPHALLLSLTWSPDGSQLVIHAKRDVVAISFGQFLQNSML